MRNRKVWWEPCASTRDVRRWQRQMLAINGIFMSLGAMFSYPYKCKDTRWLWGYGMISIVEDLYKS